MKISLWISFVFCVSITESNRRGNHLQRNNSPGRKWNRWDDYYYDDYYDDEYYDDDYYDDDYYDDDEYYNEDYDGSGWSRMTRGPSIGRYQGHNGDQPIRVLEYFPPIGIILKHYFENLSQATNWMILSKTPLWRHLEICSMPNPNLLLDLSMI